MEKSNRLKLYPAVGLFKLAALFSHAPVRNPPKASEVLLKGAVKAAEFSVGQMDGNNRGAPAPNVVIRYPAGSPLQVTSAHRGSRRGKDGKRPF